MTVTAHLKPRFLASCPSFRLYPLVVFHRDLTSFNPSIAEHDGAIYFSVRHSNMLQTGNERYGFVFALKDRARDIVNETSFGIVRLPAGNGSLECDLFADRLFEFEDVRIFRHVGRWLGLGSLPERELTSGFPLVKSVRMHLLFFDANFRLQEASPMPSPAGAEREKNWMPFPKRNELYLVYRPDPLTILSLDLERKQMLPVLGGGAPSEWSGSSQIVSYGSGSYLGVIHRRFVLHGEAIYEHAFIRIAEDFSAEISQPFHFLTFGIEFCAGLVARENEILISFGSHNDSRSYLASLARDEVDSFFGP